MYKIERGIPIALYTGRKGKSKYPWAELKRGKPGDSFFVPSVRGPNKFYTMANRWGLKISVGAVNNGSNERIGYRIWRVK